MTYEIQALDNAKNTLAVLTGLVSAGLRESVNGIAILSVETADEDDWEHIHTGRGFLRVLTQKRARLGTYRIMETKKQRQGERRTLAVSSRHILADTCAEIVAETRDCIGYTPAELLEVVLAHSAFSPGVTDFSETIPYVRFEYETVWDCLMRICTLTGGELILDEDTGAVSLKNAVGTDSGALFTYGLNLHAASRTVATSKLVNRLYAVGGGEPPLTIENASSGSGLPYIEDAASQALYGLREGVLNEPTLEAVDNLVTLPAFNGVYTDGLCAGWTKTGAPSLSRNTDYTRCLYGLVSQRVEGSADGDGVSQAVPVTPGTVYSLMANLFLGSGTVRVKITDGTAVYCRTEAVTGSGLVTVRIEDWKAVTGAVTVAIVQEGAGTSDFCIDSVQVAEGGSALPFTDGSSADVLYSRAAASLAASKEPEISYAIDLAGEDSGDLSFELGDSVTVSDKSLGIETVTRVMSREIDLLCPWRLAVKLDSASTGLADVLAALRDSREEGIRQMRRIMAGNSRAAETGSSALGFHERAFRFYGSVTADSWNGLSWNGGIFRAGDAFYSISAGSVTGLTASTAFYFYFDRMSPTGFSFSTDAQAAESDDRIHVFTALTTVSPDFLTIHPMGIVAR